MPKDGAYRLQTRAFYRTGPTSSAYPRWIAANGANEGENKSCAFLFAGNLTSPIANIYNTIYTREQVEAVAAFYDVDVCKLETMVHSSHALTTRILGNSPTISL